MRNIVSPLDGFLSPFGRRFGNPFKSLLNTLLSGASQLIAHPLEYGSMFQDRAGTTPVTAPGQLVGMVLDHGLTGSAPVLGVEGWNTPTISDPAVWSWDGTTLTATGDGTGDTARGDPVNANSSYRVSFTVGDVGAGLFQVRLGNTFIATLTGGANRTYSYFIRTSDTTGLTFTDTGGTTVIIDNISVRELPGYHATAISDAARGVFREVDGIRYIEYNGVNTAYSTPALPAPLVDKAQVFAGVRKLSDAAQGIVSEFSPSIATNNGDFALSAPNSAADNLAFESKGTTLQSAIASGYASPTTNVLTGLGDISGDLATLRIDGTQVAQSTGDQGTGNYNPAGTYPLYYGAREGTSLFFNGRHYDTLGPITRFSAANATTEQIEAAEAYYTARVI